MAETHLLKKKKKMKVENCENMHSVSFELKRRGAIQFVISVKFKSLRLW